MSEHNPANGTASGHVSPPDSAYEYYPSVVAAAVTAGLFVIPLVWHVYRIAQTRTWFCIPFIIGTVCKLFAWLFLPSAPDSMLVEIVGFGVRTTGKSHSTVLALFITQYLGILLAPIFFAAAVYMFLGRLIGVTNGQSYSIIRVTWLTKIFVGGDILCFLIQLVGGSLQAMADTPDENKRGQNIILGGLILQLVIFFFFMVAGIIFHKRIRAKPTAKSMVIDLPWEKLMWQLYAVSLLITFRNIFRMAEYAMGSELAP